MGKYFGTDGVRGKANEGLTLDMSIKIGQYLGWYYGKEKHAKILIGKDTRLSGTCLNQVLRRVLQAWGLKSIYQVYVQLRLFLIWFVKNALIVESW